MSHYRHDRNISFSGSLCSGFHFFRSAVTLLRSYSFGRKKYLFPSLKPATAPTKVGHFSLLFTQSGYSLSLLNRYGFSYARTFGKHVAASLQFNGLTHKIEGVDTYGGFFTTIGLQLFPSEKVDLGFYIQNPEQSKISYPVQKELIPVLYVAGLSWHPFNYLSLMVEMEKDQQFDPQYKFGIELQPVDILTLRGGVKGSPVELSFGAGTRWHFIVVDIGMSYHQQLGVTSGVSLTISLQKKPDKKAVQ